MYYSTEYESPVGLITLVECDGSIVGAWIEGQKYFASTIEKEECEKMETPILKKAKLWLDDYFSGKAPNIAELPLNPCGNEFRREVWKILCEIPYGEVITYGAIAKRMAKFLNRKTMSAQAVGGAVGHNPISIIIPCHRVVGSNGNLTGYAGGLDIKTKLLSIEGVKLKSVGNDFKVQGLYLNIDEFRG